MSKKSQRRHRSSEVSFLNAGSVVGVNKEERVIRGVIVAEEGVFSDRRGQFDRESLEKIVELGNSQPNGLKSHFTHGDGVKDKLSMVLGRTSNYRVDDSGSKAVVRTDLRVLKAAKEGDFVLGIAEEDPNALGASLALIHTVQRVKRLGEDGRPMPPIFRPVNLKSLDIVGDGAATSSLLNHDEGNEELDMSDLQEIKDLFTTQISELSKKNDEKIEALTTTVSELKSDLAKSQEETKKALDAEKRVKLITHLCKQAGVPEKADEFIRDAELSVEDAREKLFEHMCKNNKPVDDDEKDAKLSKAEKENAPFIKEYTESAELHSDLGVTQDDYVKLRRQESGLDPKPDLMSYATLSADEGGERK